MTAHSPTLDAAAMAEARRLLAPPAPRDLRLSAVAAAAFFALSGMTVALTVILTTATETPAHRRA